MTRVMGTNGTDHSLTLGEIEAQTDHRYPEISNFVCYPDLNAYFTKTAPFLGIRETRRIVGEYVMNRDDILSCENSTTLSQWQVTQSIYIVPMTGVAQWNGAETATIFRIDPWFQENQRAARCWSLYFYDPRGHGGNTSNGAMHGYGRSRGTRRQSRRA